MTTDVAAELQSGADTLFWSRVVHEKAKEHDAVGASR